MKKNASTRCNFIKLLVELCVFIGFIVLFTSFVRADTGMIVRIGKWDNDSLAKIIGESKKYQSAGDRINYLSRQFLETPYFWTPTATTSKKRRILPEKLVIDLSKIDCFTFLDYIVALAYSNNLEDFYQGVKLNRYKDGKVSFQKRNHFFTQWLKNNLYIKDVSHSFKNSKCIIKNINKNRILIWGIPSFRQKICYIPKKFIFDETFLNDIKNGDIVGFYIDTLGLDVKHVGIVFVKDSKIFLRHASPKQKKVAEESLEEYLSRNKWVKGLIISRAKD